MVGRLCAKFLLVLANQGSASPLGSVHACPYGVRVDFVIVVIRLVVM
jgi:hypothetical protein